MKKDKKVKVPKSVLDLRMSPKKFAKKHNIKIKKKGMSKKEKRHTIKRFNKEYSEFAIAGVNKAVKILAENRECKKIDKVKEGVENIITNAVIMKEIAKIYKKHPKDYENMKFLPQMIVNTLLYYKQDGLSDEDKAIGESLPDEKLIEFCESILKKEIKRYRNMGLDKEVAFQLATCIPTTKVFKNREWYKKLINQMYDIAANRDVDIDAIIKAVMKIDKKKGISKKDFLEGFFSEFILRKNSNKNAKFTAEQKDLHEGLIDRCLTYLDNLKSRKLRELLKQYIKRRKTAEKYKTDNKRIIKFTDHANSNSPYTTIKSVVQKLIEDDPSNEIYLS